MNPANLSVHLADASQAISQRAAANGVHAAVKHGAAKRLAQQASQLQGFDNMLARVAQRHPVAHPDKPAAQSEPKAEDKRREKKTESEEAPQEANVPLPGTQQPASPASPEPPRAAAKAGLDEGEPQGLSGKAGGLHRRKSTTVELASPAAKTLPANPVAAQRLDDARDAAFARALDAAGLAASAAQSTDVLQSAWAEQATQQVAVADATAPSAVVLPVGLSAVEGLDSRSFAVPGFTPGGDAAAPVGEVAARELYAPIDSPEFAPALSQEITYLVGEGLQEARLDLNPREMGPVNVQISLDGSAAKVFLAADLQATRQALEQAFPSLASALDAAGLTLTGGGVSQQSQGMGQNSANPGGHAPSQTREPSRRGGRPSDDAVTTEGAAAVRTVRQRGALDVYA